MSGVDQEMRALGGRWKTQISADEHRTRRDEARVRAMETEAERKDAQIAALKEELEEERARDLPVSTAAFRQFQVRFWPLSRAVTKTERGGA
jgi:hypothetical protein